MKLSVQSIVDNFYATRDSAISHSIQNKTDCSNSNYKEHLNDSNVEIIILKQEMSIQLCGLLICVLQCLKGGQTFQYTSLLLVNLIIDFFVRCETSLLPLDSNKLFSTSSNICGDKQNVNNSKPMHGDKNEKYSSAINAAANIGKHIRILRLNESFNFKQNFSNKDDKHSFESKNKANNKKKVYVIFPLWNQLSDIIPPHSFFFPTKKNNNNATEINFQLELLLQFVK